LKHVLSMDSAMLEDMMNQYGNDIWNYAYFLTKDRELAKDIAQEVFIKAYYSIHTFRGQSTLKTWLLTITRNTAFRSKRSAFLRKVRLLAYVPSGKTVPSAEQESLDRQVVDDIWNIILDLPQKYREVLILDMRYDLSIDEMAQLLKVAAGTVKSRLHRARGKVEQKLKEVR